MQVDIRTRGIYLTESLRAHCERQLDFALDRFAPRIIRVVARLADINGPRGGQDKQCTLIIYLRGSVAFTVESTGADLYAAIASAADRAGHAVARKVQRGHARQLVALN